MNIVPLRSKRMALPTLPSGSVVNGSEAAPPAGNLPMVPGLPKLTTKRLPSGSAAGPSMPKVYSPAGVTCTLSNSFVSAAVSGVAMTSKMLLHRHQKFLPDVVAIVVAALAIQIGIGRPEEASEAGFVYSVPLCHDDDLGGRYFAAFLVRLAEELALRRAELDLHPRSRNHFCYEQVRGIEQARVTGLGLRQVFATWRHQLLCTDAAQACAQLAGVGIARIDPAILRQHEAQHGRVLVRVRLSCLQAEIRMAADAVLLDEAFAQRGEPDPVLRVLGDEGRELVDQRLAARVAGQQRRRIAGSAIDADDRLVLVLDQPDRAVLRNRHADGRALRPRAVDAVPAGDQLLERRSTHLAGVGLIAAGRIGRATDVIAHRRGARPGKAVIVDVVDEDPAAGRAIAVQTDQELAFQLREFGAVIIEHRERRTVRRQQ